jgi:hypothetical protein
MAKHRPVSVESAGHQEVSGGQHTSADHRSMFDQTLSHSRPMYDERYSPMYEHCNITQPNTVE